jgi:hypothetical protein
MPELSGPAGETLAAMLMFTVELAVGEALSDTVRTAA